MRHLLSFVCLTLTLALAPSLCLGGASETETSGIPPQQALQELENGNKRFIEGKLKNDKVDASRRKQLADGQKPNAIILSCSDSRVPPELVFDQGLGEIFAIRVAGNVLGAATVASIEYAVEHLGTRLIVVLGHESCGAVRAALTIPPEKSAGSPDLDLLVSMIRPAIEGTTSGRALASNEASSDKTLRKPVMANVEAVSKRLVTRSSIIRKRVEAGEVAIVPGIYSLSTGVVEFWNRPGSSSIREPASTKR